MKTPISQDQWSFTNGGIVYTLAEEDGSRMPIATATAYGHKSAEALAGEIVSDHNAQARGLRNHNRVYALERVLLDLLLVSDGEICPSCGIAYVSYSNSGRWNENLDDGEEDFSNHGNGCVFVTAIQTLNE